MIEANENAPSRKTTKAQYHKALGELVDALFEDLRYEVGESAVVDAKVQQAVVALGGDYADAYLGRWMDDA